VEVYPPASREPMHQPDLAKCADNVQPERYPDEEEEDGFHVSSIELFFGHVDGTAGGGRGVTCAVGATLGEKVWLTFAGNES
jgi:hypothetical protein